MSLLSKEAFVSAPIPIPLAIVQTLPRCSTFELYERLVENDHYAVLLESGSTSHGTQIAGDDLAPIPSSGHPGRTSSQDARYSIIASSPWRIFRVAGQRLECFDPDGHATIVYGDPISGIRDLIGRIAVPRPPGFPPFFGGAIGYFGYDCVQWFERLPRRITDDLSLADAELALFDRVAVIDHSAERLWLIFTPFKERFLKEPREALYEEGVARLTALQERLLTPRRKAEPPTETVPGIIPGQTQEEYAERVRYCLDYIGAGDIYQANLSHRFELDLGGRSPRSIYRKLRRINPSPFAALLEFPDVALVGCSPERLVRLQGSDVETRPIAGTRPRGATCEEDERLAQDLLLNEKERAEHLMLVDLERNDLGRVCSYGSVHVNDFMVLERYSHVTHIVSNIRGRLARGRDALDLIQAVFPGGTVTGVPKIRCLEILDELEPVRRGPYTGSVGYISASGDLDLNIIIRTLVITGGRGYLHVGAGIVADSDPSREYQETLFKAEALLEALREG